MEAAVPNLALNSWHPSLALLTAKRFLAALGQQVGRLYLALFCVTEHTQHTCPLFKQQGEEMRWFFPVPVPFGAGRTRSLILPAGASDAEEPSWFMRSPAGCMGLGT